METEKSKLTTNYEQSEEKIQNKILKMDEECEKLND